MSSVNFGKYKGTTIDELVLTDPKYLLWLAKQDWVKDDLIAAIKVAHGRIVLPFGRHSGESLDSIQESDPSDYKWLLKDSRIE